MCGASTFKNEALANPNISPAALPLMFPLPVIWLNLTLAVVATS